MSTTEIELAYKVISDIKFNPDNPRTTFDERSLSELSDSIVSEGLLEPLVVRPDGTLIAGERRTRAILLAVEAKRLPANMEVPCVIREGTEDGDELIAALIENLHREDLDPIDEANGYYSLLGIGIKQSDLAKRVGRSAAHISKRLALLRLDPKVQSQVQAGKVTIERALALAAIEDPAEQVKLVSQPDHMVAHAIEKQKTAKKLGKLTAELEGLGVEVSSSIAAAPAGKDWEQVGEDVVDSDFKGKIPKGVVLVQLLVYSYSDTVRLRFWKLIDVSDSVKAPADSAEKKAKAREKAVKVAKIEALATAVKKPKKSELAATALTMAIEYAITNTQYDRDMVKILGLDLVDANGEKTSPYIVLRDYAAVNETNSLRVLHAYYGCNYRTSTAYLEAAGFDEKSVKVGA